MAAVAERLFREVVPSNQGEFPDEHGVSVVGPNDHLKNKESVREALKVRAPLFDDKHTQNEAA